MAETLSLISVISFVLAAVFLIVAVILWFVFNIPLVVGDLSGRNAKKSIENMRRNNENSGKKAYKPSKKNEERGKLTSTMHGIDKNVENGEDYETGLLHENLAKTRNEQETGILIDDTTGLLTEDNETALLVEEEPFVKRSPSKIKIKLLQETIYIHTEEKI